MKPRIESDYPKALKLIERINYAMANREGPGWKMTLEIHALDVFEDPFDHDAEIREKLITLDDEDLEYLKNKYYPLAKKHAAEYLEVFKESAEKILNPTDYE